MYNYVAVQHHYWHNLVFSFVSYTLQYTYITIHHYNGKCQIAPRSKMEPQHLHLQTTMLVTHPFILWCMNLPFYMYEFLFMTEQNYFQLDCLLLFKNTLTFIFMANL